MASVLYRIGAFTVRHRWQVIVGWVVLLAGLSVLVLAVQRPASNNLTIPGTQSQQALDLLNSRFPGAGGAQAQVVFSTSGTAPITSASRQGGDGGQPGPAPPRPPGGLGLRSLHDGHGVAIRQRSPSPWWPTRSPLPR